MTPLLRVILVEPEFAGNLGSVARIMANFACHELTLVKPLVAREAEEARRMAVKGHPVLANAQTCHDLRDAIQDCHWVVGFSRRSGSHRRDFLPHTQLAIETHSRLARHEQVALVFGSEKNGLSTQDAAYCQQLVQFPTDEACPSINLAQAVALALYEICREREQVAQELIPHETASRGAMEGMYSHLEAVFTAIHFWDKQNPLHIMTILRRLLNRAQPNDQEIRIVRGMCRNMLNALRLAEGQKPD